MKSATRFFTLTLLLMLTPALHAMDTYILCEGNFGSSNASLWSLDPSLTSVEGPVHWNLSDNPLGDIGQSIYIHEDLLYLVMNNSHTIEVMDLTGENPVYLETIDVPGAGPRYMAFRDNQAYISCWNLAAVLVYDLGLGVFQDTIALDGLPEEMVFYSGHLYVAVPLTPTWDADNRVLEFMEEEGEWSLLRSHETVAGPEHLLLDGSELYVSCTYYDDAWQAHAGTSLIDLRSNSVTNVAYGQTTNYGADLVRIGDTIYRTYQTGIAPLQDDLTIDTGAVIGDYANIYSVAAFDSLILFGLTDYVAPDEVVVTDPTGSELATVTVGALPGSFAHHSAPVSRGESPVLPDVSRLHANWPNPFNPTTTLRYSLESANQMILSIHDVRGALVRTLATGMMAAGEYQMTWDGLSDNGAAMPSGTYFARLRTGTEVQVRSMTLLR